MDIEQFTAHIKIKAQELGFDWVCVLPVTEPPHIDFFAAWATPAYAGDMRYLLRNLDRRRNPRLLSDEIDLRSLLVLGVNYHQFSLREDVAGNPGGNVLTIPTDDPPVESPPEQFRDVLDDPSRGIIASYAWGDDYHDIIKPLLFELDAFIAGQSGRTTRGKCMVDTGPVLERDWAMHAGLGFTGKNCCTIRPGAGSWLFLATIMIPEVLAYDPPPRADGPTFATEEIFSGLSPAVHAGTWSLTGDTASHTGTCGRCTRCLTACPTDAFVGPFHLNPQRCISYWTIESQAPIPLDLRPLFGNRIFGCDICQEVCPWNQRLPTRRPRLEGLEAQTARVAPSLLEGFDEKSPYWLDETTFRRHFRRSPIKRAKRRGMLRNVCVALGNSANPAAVPALIQALHDDDPLPRGHAAWALGQIWRRHQHPGARAALTVALADEADLWVRAEIEAALEDG